MKKNAFNHFAKTMLFSACVCLAATAFDINAYPAAKVYAKESAQEKTEFEYYEAKVNHGVNVRVGAGANQDKLTVDGKGVSLAAGTKVLILDTVDVDGKAWYYIRFTYKDQELTGYSTSTYIDKTGGVITPTPMPTPTPEPTPVPTKEPEAVPTTAPVVTQAVQPSDSDSTAGGKTSKAPILILLALGCAGVIGVVIYLVKKNQKENEVLSNSEVARKVDSLKNMVQLSENERTMKQKTASAADALVKKPEVPAKKAETAVKKPEVPAKKSETGKAEKRIDHKNSIMEEEQIKVVKRNRLKKESELSERRNDVYVVEQEENNLKSAMPISFGSDEENEMNEKDRNALRQAVNRLREHDIIIHKYFGRGEVYDNSDVRLIEIRFHGDARFLNKDQLVSKHLIQITNERSI